MFKLLKLMAKRIYDNKIILSVDDKCPKQLLKSKNEINYLSERITTLTSTLSKSITPVDITIKQQGIVSPGDVIGCIQADAKYSTFTLDEWKIILKQVYDATRPKYKWSTNVFDCDDIALLFSSILSYSAYKSGFKVQPALAISWSRRHAFNLFITNDNKIYVYEPQNNKVMTLDEANKDSMYRVAKVWFMS